jgi:hypothetical protein
MDLSELKKDIENQFTKLRLKRRDILSVLRKKLEEKEVDKIKNSIKNR